MREFVIRADEIQFGKELGPITQYVDVDPTKQRFTIETQTNDLLEELLSKVPNSQRTAKVLNNIHITIERFKQLRSQFSEFDAYGNIVSAKIKGSDWKPLASDLVKMKTLLFWILPVVKNIKNYSYEEFDNIFFKNKNLKDFVDFSKDFFKPTIILSREYDSFAPFLLTTIKSKISISS